MNQEIRNKLRNVVTQCRRLLEESISQDLEGKFGIFAKREQVTADPNAKMTHLSEEEQAARRDILDHFGHIKARGFRPREALDQLVREIAFTHLNRLCAYKMMESREVYVGGQRFREAVSRGVNSNGVKFYLAEHPEEERLFNTGHQDIAYRHFLNWLGGLLSDEIGVLFDPNDSANRLYPRQKTLDEVLGLLNSGGIKPEETELREEWPKVWSQDETLGWVYQYFTPRELRDQARKESPAPRNSYELAFRNQFFTPRYVVEVLTDNTLGRIWYEMRKGDTKLTNQCRYLLRRPTEIFLKEGDHPPKDAIEEQDDLSQEELLKVPSHILHRAKRDPRELKILDPASGSGHFLLYCFDLLLSIYEEAFADPDLGSALHKDYPTLEDLRRDVPRLILAHNLHGIDIDLRCTQIAALALWLRCQRAYQEMGLKKDRPKITRSNFVCAEPMPGEEQMLKEFVNQLEPRLLGQVVEVVFEKMKLAGEAGSLLKIEEEIRDAVAGAKQQWIRETARATSRKGEPLLFTQTELDRIAGRPGQPSLFDLSDITNEQFFEQAEAKVIEALRQYAQGAQNGHRLQRKLFAEDAERGFAFVDLCQKNYDVVLMNPPFGLPTSSCLKYLETKSKTTYIEIYASFVERYLSRANSGFVGAITSRSFLTMSRLEKWRKASLVDRIHFLLDLGLGVMDEAFVEACVYVSSSRTLSSALVAFDLRSSDDKEHACRSINWQFPSADDRLFIMPRARLKTMPGAKLLYSVGKSLHALMLQRDKFEPTAGIVRTGLTTFDDFRFLRLAWEPSPKFIGRGVYWEYFSKGGEYSKYYTDVHLIVNRQNDGAELAEANRRLNGQVAQSRQGSKFYFLPGLTFTSRSAKGFTVRALPAGCVISHNAPSVYTNEESMRFYALAWVNSRLIRSLVELQANAAYFVPGSVKELPWTAPNRDQFNEVTNAAKELCALYAYEDQERETSRIFRAPTLSTSLIDTFTAKESKAKSSSVRARQLQAMISDRVDSIYKIDSKSLALDVLGFDPDDEALIEPVPIRGIAVSLIMYAVGVAFGRWDLRKCIQDSESEFDPFADLPVCPVGMLQEHDGLPIKNVPDGNYPVTISPSGILPDDPVHQDDVIRRIREMFEAVWHHTAETIEKEACETLGVKDLREYLRKSGNGGLWEDHASHYSMSRRKAPIYWLLQSTKKNYGLWLYYQRLDKDLLFKALLNYVEPKLRLEVGRLDALRTQKTTAGNSGTEPKRLAKEIERQEDFLSELRDFEDKVRRVANLHLEPDLNDGVVLNIAPLHELVPWKEAKDYWEELLAGEYEWSSIGKQLRQKGLVK
jgi:hypothetical protein